MICAVCSSSQLHIVDLHLKGGVTSDGAYSAASVNHNYCGDCGYVFNEGTKALDVQHHYQDDYDYLLDNEELEYWNIESSQTTNMILVDFFSSFVQNKSDKRFLDVGAGKGNFISDVHKSFDQIKCYGLEPSKAYSSLEKKEFLAGAYKAFFDPKSFENIRFDYISMVQVLEHIDNPLDFLRGMKTVMTDESYLIVEVPNFSNNKVDLLTPDHFSKFTQESIENLFNLAGFKVLKAHVPTASVTMKFVVTGSDVQPVSSYDVGPVIQESVDYLKRCIEDTKHLENQPLAIYGQSNIAEYLLGSGGMELANITCVIDDNVLSQGLKWNNIDIVSYDQFRKDKSTDYVFLAMSDCYHEKVKEKLQDYKVFGTIQ